MLLLPDHDHSHHRWSGHGSRQSAVRLVRWQPSNNLRHLRIGVDPEALVLCDARQLHVLAVQLLLHDLLQRLERQNLSLGQGKRLVELVLQLGLCTLRAGPDSFGIVAVEGAGWFSMVPIPID
jgi:hypothetical protein